MSVNSFYVYVISVFIVYLTMFAVMINLPTFEDRMSLEDQIAFNSPDMAFHFYFEKIGGHGL